MKTNLKPWQIGVCCAAGIAVLGGAGTGIYFGVNRAIDDKVKDQVDAAMESVYSSEAALDESETPTQAAGETTTESTTAAQPTKEPETVLVYVTPTETEKTDAPAAPDPQPEPEPEPEIELVYDEQLTKEVVEILSNRCPEGWGYVLYEKNDSCWDELFQRVLREKDYPVNTELIFVNEYSSPTSEAIVSDWTAVSSPGAGAGIKIYKANGNLICAAIYP